MEIERYFQDIEDKLNLAFSSAIKARDFGYDPVDYVEIPVAKNIAERIEGLISVIYPNIKNKGLAERIIELEKQYGAQNWRIPFIISLEVANEKFCNFSSKKEAMEVGLRVALAYITNGIVSSPLEGFTRLEIKKRRDNKEYLALYFAGPIRSAGTTAVCIFVAVSDYMRKNMGYGVFDPSENEVKRFVTELHDFHERITNLQYLPTKEEIEFMVKHLPLQIDGEASEELEVSNYKDLDRVETNLIRNGVCLVIGEGLTQKAAKFYGRFSQLMNEFGMEDWKFLEEFVALQKKLRAKEKKKEETKIEADYNYIKDLVAGRPILTYPLEIGGLRLRYGRARNSGLSSTCIHPATMIILNNYIASGTQLKLERPGKSSTISVCDLIEGPIVKLKNGDVLLLDNVEDSEKYVNDIEEILFLGDILISYGDFFNRAHKLVPCGYNEEWHSLELEKIENKNQIVKKIIDNPYLKISGVTAIETSKKFNVPLHPRYTYHWNNINKEQFLSFVNWFKGKVDKEDKIILPFIYNLDYDVEDRDPKRVMELLGIPHKIFHKEYVIVDVDDAYVLNNLNLGKESDKENVLEIINETSGIKVRDKSGTFIGARMGRPEKAKQRKLTGSPQVLFPVGSQGGKMRSVQSARKIGKVTADFAIYHCEKCNNKTIYSVCEKCNNKTLRRYYCKVCDKEKDSVCKEHNSFGHKKIDIDINHYYDSALSRLNIEGYDDLIKGVRGTSNKESIPENLAKGILRSKHNLYVNKDGTTRYDMTEMAITAFKPSEINLNLKKLKELGYTKDIYGNDIENEDQIVELKPQDIILPACDEGLDEGADKVLFDVANFIDDLLINFYKLKGFYNLKKREDLIGHLVIGLSPHTSAGIVARIIGFSRLQGLYAHPLLHCMMRRDCFTYDNYMPIMENGIWKIVKIGEIVEKIKPDKKVDFFGTLSKKVSNYHTIGLNENNETTTVKINDFTKHKPSKILRIKTQDGRELRVTETHKFLVFENNDFKKVMASKLKKGMKMVIPVNVNIMSKDLEFIELKNYFATRSDVMIRNVGGMIKKAINRFGTFRLYKNLGLTKRSFYNFLIRDSFPLPVFLLLSSLTKKEIKLPKKSYLAAKRDNVNLPVKIPLNKEVLNLMGLYVAEGYSRKKVSKKGFYQVSFSASENEIRERIIKTMKKYFYLEPSYLDDASIVYSSRLLYELFVDILKCGRNAYEKRIPELILNLPLEKLKYFLQGYFDGDGSVSDSDSRVTCDSVAEGLLQDLEFSLRRYGIYNYRYTYTKKPGLQVRKFYIRKNREIPEFTITKLIIPSSYYEIFYKKIGFSLKRKQKILRHLINNTRPYGMKIENDENYTYPEIKEIIEDGFEETYCLNVENHIVMSNSLLLSNCDGDEACVLLLMDGLLNFSRKYLPSHRGTTQDAPLVLTSRLIPSEVDDMIYDMDIVSKYPLELYETALKYGSPFDVKIKVYKETLNKPEQYQGLMFTHNTSNINIGVRCSAYKSIPTMVEKVRGQMSLAEKIRAVDESDVARLIIERHFIRDIKGNLRKFGMQGFRCVDCNMKYRRPPLTGNCVKCKGRIIFTVSEGSIVKYLEPSIELAEKYDLPLYLKQTLELTKKRIESVFGKEKEVQRDLVKWFS